MKRMMIVFMIAALTLTTISTSYAQSISATTVKSVDTKSAKKTQYLFDDAKLSFKECQIAEKELKILDNIGLDSGRVNRITEIEGDLKYDFVVDNEDVSEIVITEKPDGDIVLDIMEGNKKDEITYTDEGEILLDGELVIIKEDTGQNSDEIVASGSLSDTWYTDTNPCPSKTWEYKSKKTINDIATTKLIVECTKVGIMLLIGAAFGVAAAAYERVYTVGASIINAATGTNSTHMSGVIYTYYPKGGRNIGNNRWVEKKVGYFYPKKNCDGKETKKIRYKVTQYY